jgi:hypothetical protein
MKWLAALLAVALLAGCGGSDEAADSASTTTTASTEEAPPRTYEELLARLPPFDEPASEEVETYRRAVIETFYGRCLTKEGGADEASFVRANRKVLDEVPVFGGLKLASEYSIGHLDGNGCPEGLGPPTSLTTYRTYRLPAGTTPQEVMAYYEPRLDGWATAGTSGCEQTFTRGEAYIAVSACGETLQLVARGRERVEIPDPPAPPPRPFGAQYPLVADARETPEPMSYEVEPGETCERITTSYAPSVIIPPTPGIRAEFKNEPPAVGGGGSVDQHVLVEWSFDKILGDCPPTQLLLTIPNPKRGQPPFGIRADVRTRSGTQQLPIIDSFSEAYVLWATAESVDGHRGRTVSVLIRRER